MAEEAVSKNFIEQEMKKILQKAYTIIMYPFPTGTERYLHIGHAKSILLNYGLAQKYNGTFHMRFDDTNPTKEKTEFVSLSKRISNGWVLTGEITFTLHLIILIRCMSMRSN